MGAVALKQVAENLDVKTALSEKIAANDFAAWIAPCAVEGNNLVANSRFNADYISNAFKDALVAVGVSVITKRPQLRIIKNEIAAAPVSQNKISFDNFVCNEQNKFAIEALKKVAGADPVGFSPLVIYGATGTGKTMLMESLAKNPRTIMTTGAAFVNDFVRSMKSGAVFQWKDSLRNVDTFILDDVQTLAGKRASLEEFSALLNDLIRMGKNVVITANIAPSQIAGFDRRLVSLLSSGLSVDLVAPGADVRAAILKKNGVADALAKSIAERAPANGHILSGIVKKIAAWTELDCGQIDEAVCERLLGDVLEKTKTPIAMVKNMCVKLGMSFDDIISASRTRAVVFARQKIMAALKVSTTLTLAEIGNLVGRDHASVLYALAQIEKAKQTDMLLASEIIELSK
ncbi:MAG: AAA family ATPase [Rickettsiales bacterium]|nr:AAA family ATPase [Rickettsiales bacterium]